MIFIAPSHDSLTNQHRAYKEMPLQAVYSPVTKWTGRIYDERELDQVVRKIFTLLRAGRPSPTVVEVPGDLAGKDVGDYKYQPLAPQKLRSGADPASIEEAARTLIEAKRPLLYAGHGTLIAGTPARFAGIVKTSERYIASGSPARSPMRNAVVGDVGETRTSNRANASS